jgi:hypothetical protein
MACRDLFDALDNRNSMPTTTTTTVVQVSSFELYRGQLFDLLAGRRALELLEDRKGK